ncbi:MAG: hypothetical protein COS15_02200 [Caldiserica bacterium CG02_land_8_20_14_3_00_36_38]|nr:MAG: hypothetical protein COS15_02200 [Caldiserica bacterium CG02_land_8_20_14_3_00_36_38]PIX29485.1 MAG: hypothetical protein COZ65_02015 [Caldiserica bacterium CG_4_8_14_3_um_filter_35_18]
MLNNVIIFVEKNGKNVGGNFVKERSFYTTKEAAKYIGVSTSTVYRMEKRGLICSIKTPGGERCF